MPTRDSNAERRSLKLPLLPARRTKVTRLARKACPDVVEPEFSIGTMMQRFWSKQLQNLISDSFVVIERSIPRFQSEPLKSVGFAEISK